MGYSEHKRAFIIQQYFKIKSTVKRQEAFRNKFRNSKVLNRACPHVRHSACVFAWGLHVYACVSAHM